MSGRGRVRAVTAFEGDEGLPCPRCDADDWVIVRAGFWRTLLEWLGGGGRFGTQNPMLRRCRHCGFEEQLGGVAYVLHHRPTWWTLPWRVIRAILDRRTVIPNPLVYLAALALGSLIGVVLDVWLSWPSWLGGLGFPAAVWLISLASVFSRLGGPRSLRTELLDVLDPSGSWERHIEEEEDVFRSCPFPLYGLDASWTGLRHLGGHGGGDEELSDVELAHGDPTMEGASIRVRTALPDQHQSFHLHQAAIELWHSSQRPPRDLPPHLRGAWMHRRFEESRMREADWTKVPIPVDGERVDFDWLEEGSDWVAQTVIGDLTVTVRGHGLPVASVGLATVHDIEQYVEGHRRFLEEQRQQFEESAEDEGGAAR